jgi:hypothetical protein
VTKKPKKPEQADMFGMLNPKVGAMRRLRDMRRKAGFVEVSVWVPAEDRERIKQDAAELIQSSGKHFPSAGDK